MKLELSDASVAETRDDPSREDVSVIFVVQFFRSRRRVPEVIRTLNLAAENALAALAGAKRVVPDRGRPELRRFA